MRRRRNKGDPDRNGARIKTLANGKRVAVIDPGLDHNWLATFRRQIQEKIERDQRELVNIEDLDLESEVIAHRGWELGFDGQRFSLASGYGSGSFTWVPGEPQVAACSRVPHADEVAPHWSCTCGLYAAKDSTCSVGTVIGSVRLWGKYVEHETGWRAQYAYPKCLSSIRCAGCSEPRPFRECSISVFTSSGSTNRPGLSVVCRHCQKDTGDGRRWVSAAHAIEQIEYTYSLEVD